MFLSTSHLLTFFVAVTGVNRAYAACEPEISYPAPKYSSTTLQNTFNEIDTNLRNLIDANVFKATSFSLEISSSERTLYSHHYHAQSLGGSPITGSSRYDAESQTKLFTALAILKLEAAGKLNLDDEVTEYIPSLLNRTSKIAWKGITIRSLLSHSSGIPDNYAAMDLLYMLPDTSTLGLPPLSASETSKLPKCGIYTDWKTPCTYEGLDEYLHQVNPVFAPQKETSYSNLGFDLLGQVIAKVSGTTCEDYIDKAIFKSLNLREASFTVPDDSVAAKAPSGSDWGDDQGSNNPAGGMYISPSNMTGFLRWVLNKHDKITPTLDWFEPAAWNSGSHSLLGYPWEIMRTTEILSDTARPVTFYTKSGSGTDYYSYSIIIPQYGLVVFLATAGELSGSDFLWTKVINPLVVAAESEAQSQLKKTYGGVYKSTDRNLNSSITFTQSEPKSLYVSSWVSNSTNVLESLASVVAAEAGSSGDMYFQLLPTFLTRRSAVGHVGEVWRLINVIDDYSLPKNATTVWNDYCVVNVDPMSYGGVPLNELVFWRNSSDPASAVTEVTLSAFRVTLKRE